MSRQGFHRSWLEPSPEHEPTYTLERQIAEARREMGEARWAEINAEWNTPADGGDQGRI